MAIDVIIPHLNQGKYLGECLESIRLQDVEKTVILVDGGSTDNAFEVLKGFPEVQVHNVKSNLREAVNYGLANSSGDYVVCFASDNVMLPRYLEEAKQILDKYPSVGLVYGGAIGIDQDSRVTELLPHGGHFWRERLLEHNFIDFSEGMFRRECLKETGLIPKGIKYHLDWWLWIKISEKWGAVGLGHPVIYYRSHPNSHSSLKQRDIDQEYMLLKTKIDKGKL